MLLHRLVPMLFVALCACAPVAYHGSVTVATPDLVEVGPGVRVIADYDEPIFFADGFYWWSIDGYWYRSASYTGGWVVATPPRAILTIGPTHRYRHYRPAGYVHRHRPVPANRLNRPVVRDHRNQRARR